MKLTAVQLGVLAIYVERAVRDFPEKESSFEPQQWEIELRRLVDSDSNLPKYEELERTYDETLEYLLSYFS